MEEARAVLERLARIEVLERERASTAHLLAELRELLREAEAWVEAEGGEEERAADAVESLRDALERRAVAAARR